MCNIEQGHHYYLMCNAVVENIVRFTMQSFTSTATPSVPRYKHVSLIAILYRGETSDNEFSYLY